MKMGLGVWLLALVEPLIARVLISLGFSVVSIVGMDSVLQVIKNSFLDNINSMPSEWLQLILFLWIGKGIGIIFGAMTTKFALWSIHKSTILLGKNS